MGIGNDGLQAEAERDAHNEAVEALRLIVRTWDAGIDTPLDPAIDAARAVLAEIDAAKSPPHAPGTSWTCPSCGEASAPREVNTTWQQWRCACCGSWNVLAETR